MSDLEITETRENSDGDPSYREEKDWILVTWSRDINGEKGVQLVHLDEISALRLKNMKENNHMAVLEVSEKDIASVLELVEEDTGEE